MTQSFPESYNALSKMLDTIPKLALPIESAQAKVGMGKGTTREPKNDVEKYSLMFEETNRRNKIECKARTSKPVREEGAAHADASAPFKSR